MISGIHMVRGAAVTLMLGLGSVGFGCGGGPTPEDLNRSDKEYELARALEEEKNVPGAITHLQKSIELDPENVRAHLLLGYVHNYREDFPKAEKSLREGVRLMADRGDMATTLAEAKNLLGVVLMRQRKYSEAVPLFRDSASDMLNQAPWYAWGNLGWAEYEQKHYKEALEALEQAVRIQPRFCVGYYWLGKTHFDKGDFANADKALTSSIEADERCKGSQNQRAWRLRGETRAQLGEREDAVADFERCVELGAKSEDGLACRRILDGLAP
jgi:type IV pilus assembly protein PilF